MNQRTAPSGWRAAYAHNPIVVIAHFATVCAAAGDAAGCKAWAEALVTVLADTPSELPDKATMAEYVRRYGNEAE